MLLPAVDGECIPDARGCQPAAHISDTCTYANDRILPDARKECQLWLTPQHHGWRRCAGVAVAAAAGAAQQSLRPLLKRPGGGTRVLEVVWDTLLI